jgi:hypothetical protein
LPRFTLLLLFLLPISARAAITFGHVDDFQDGTTLSWSEGPNGLSPPTNIANGGPAGAGDKYVRHVASGTGGASSAQVMLNADQWTGDFLAAGITQIAGDFANFGTGPLYIRLAFRNNGGTRYASTVAQPLAADGVWRHFGFDITPGTLTPVVGADSYTDLLSSVNEMRILSAKDAPTYIGDRGNSSLGVDNLRAQRLPGDANGDGKVNFTDFLNLETGFGKSSFTDPLDAWTRGDFDFNGAVSRPDFMTLYQAFGQSQPLAGAPVPAAAVPETTFLLGAPLMTFFLRPRRRGTSRRSATAYIPLNKTESFD